MQPDCPAPEKDICEVCLEERSGNCQDSTFEKNLLKKLLPSSRLELTQVETVQNSFARFSSELHDHFKGLSKIF